MWNRWERSWLAGPSISPTPTNSPSRAALEDNLWAGQPPRDCSPRAAGTGPVPKPAGLFIGEGCVATLGNAGDAIRDLDMILGSSPHKLCAFIFVFLLSADYVVEFLPTKPKTL